MWRKKSTMFSLHLPMRGRFEQTLKTVFSCKTTLKNRSQKFKNQKICSINPHVEI